MKLVRRLTAYLLLVFCVVFAADAWLGISDHLALFADDIRRDHRVLGQAFSAAVEAAWRERGEERALELIRAANQREEAVRIRLVRPGEAEGSPAGAQALGERRPGDAPLQLREREGGEPRLVTWVPLSIPDAPGAALEIKSGTQEIGRAHV